MRFRRCTWPLLTGRRVSLDIAALFFSAALLCACASLAPKPLPLDVRLDTVRISRFEPFDTRVVIGLVVHNPNGFDVAVNDMEAILAVHEEPLLTGRLKAPQTLAAHADTGVEIEIQTDFGKMATALQRITYEQSFRYSVRGSALLQTGIPLSISRSGELPASDFLGPKR